VLIKRLPFNAAFWSVVVSFLSCIPSRKIKWKRIIAVLLLNALVFGLLHGLMTQGDGDETWYNTSHEILRDAGDTSARGFRLVRVVLGGR
jgi:membrane protease YdiL (CAAX protease family)